VRFLGNVKIDLLGHDLWEAFNNKIVLF